MYTVSGINAGRGADFKDSEEAWKQIDTNPKGALVPYKKLQHLSKDLKKRHDETEEAAVHLVDYVERTSNELWDSMKEKLSGEFQAILTKMGWPSTTLDLTKDPAFEVGFVKLLDLQEPYGFLRVHRHLRFVGAKWKIGSLNRLWRLPIRT